MAKEICTVCGREIDSRGMSGHMKTHKAEPKKNDGQDSGVISYPSNEQETDVKQDVVPGNTETPSNSKQPKKKKAVKKPVASKPASSSTSKPDPRGQLKTETEHIADLKSAGHPKDSGAEEWKGFFR